MGQVNWILSDGVFVDCQNIELWVWSKVGLESDLSILVRLKVKLSERGILQKVLKFYNLQRTLIGIVWIIIATIASFIITFFFTFAVASFTTIIRLIIVFIIGATLTWTWFTISLCIAIPPRHGLCLLLSIIWIGTATTESQDQVYCAFFLDVVVAESAAIFKLLSTEN